MIGNDWDQYLEEEYRKPYFNDLINFVESEYEHKIIYPKKNLTRYADLAYRSGVSQISNPAAGQNIRWRM